MPPAGTPLSGVACTRPAERPVADPLTDAGGPGACPAPPALLPAGMRARGRGAADVAKRVPGARVVVQVDEQVLPRRGGGPGPDTSGLSRLAAIEADTLRDQLAHVIGPPIYTVVHSCARRRKGMKMTVIIRPARVKHVGHA